MEQRFCSEALSASFRVQLDFPILELGLDRSMRSESSFFFCFSSLQENPQCDSFLHPTYSQRTGISASEHSFSDHLGIRNMQVKSAESLPFFHLIRYPIFVKKGGMSLAHIHPVKHRTPPPPFLN
jgi:hypothetical protein